MCRYISIFFYIKFHIIFLRVVAVDLRGYGDSEKPNGRGAYKMDVLVADVRQIIETLGT